ncbi:sensor histidine kinase [Marinomonas pollencensis]|uniref:histidine kinase n=1 Tax=Marinomonas pollencensis TaxID=491954 RepID=A0A3E0DM69_9GAMM|nr:ATP-binding protein [Marinomonas pollencensis]REG83908.1 histidine kinase/DNA gyrase B/HSP90-like ATPase [Marinomonas pollencensis]
MLSRLTHRLSLPKLQHWYIYGLATFFISTLLLSFGLVIYSSDGSQATKQRIYEDSLWNSLQFQLQSYRFLNYLVQIDENDLPLQGAAYAQYDLLMSRVDLLRNGEVGYLIRGLTGGRTVRLLNIITGELELISLNLSKIEAGDLSYLDDMTTRLKRLDNQVNEFTVLVSQDTNKYIAQQRRALGDKLERVRILMVCFLASLLLLCLCIAKGLSVYRKNHKDHKQRALEVQRIHDEKAKILTLVVQETRPQIQALLGQPGRHSGTKKSNSALSTNIKETANELLHTINMFSDLVLMDAQKLNLVSTTESLRSSLDNYVHIFAHKLQPKGLKLVTYVDPDLPDWIDLDFKRVKEIILELLQNAITHTSQGSISIHLRPSSVAPSQPHNGINSHTSNMLQIAIKDTGFGLEHALQKHLRTSPLTQSDQHSILQSDIGLGLSLCYQLVHLMGGDIHFSSEPNSGTEFWIDIPYHAAEKQPEKNNNFVCAEQKRALIFTRDEHLAKFLGLQLKDINIEAGLYSEGPHHEGEEIDLVIITEPDVISPETESHILHWQNNGALVLYDHQLELDPEQCPYLARAQSLTFPLTQSQLNIRLKRYFNAQKT